APREGRREPSGREQLRLAGWCATRSPGNGLGAPRCPPDDPPTGPGDARQADRAATLWPTRTSPRQPVVSRRLRPRTRGPLAGSLSIRRSSTASEKGRVDTTQRRTAGEGGSADPARPGTAG